MNIENIINEINNLSTEDKVKITSILFDSLSNEDKYVVAGEYIETLLSDLMPDLIDDILYSRRRED